MNDVATIADPVPDQEIWKPSAALNPTRLAALWGLAGKLADSGLVPESLRTTGSTDKKVDLPRETVISNCFAVVEQADRWDFPVFALLAAAAIVRGKLCFEGKVIAAVLESRYDVKLHYVWAGSGDAMTVQVFGSDPKTGEVLTNLKGEELTIEGSVSKWKTAGSNSPWRPGDYRKMLAYRGAREWARLHRPAAMIGVHSIDEIAELDYESRAQRAREVSPLVHRLSGGAAGAAVTGFSADHVKALPTGTAMAVEPLDAKDTVVAVSGAAAAEPTTNYFDKVLGKPDDMVWATEAERARIPALKMKAYSEALMKAGNPLELKTVSDAYWSEHGGKPAADTPEGQAAQGIINAHRDFRAGKIDEDGLNVVVREICQSL